MPPWHEIREKGFPTKENKHTSCKSVGLKDVKIKVYICLNITYNSNYFLKFDNWFPLPTWHGCGKEHD